MNIVFNLAVIICPQVLAAFAYTEVFGVGFMWARWFSLGV